MRGASRTSFAGLVEQLEAENITSAAVATRLGNELFAVVGLLDNEHGLRRALSDPGKPAAEKAAVASACASSERASPPSICSVRSASVLVMRGISILASRPNTRRNRIVPIMNSGHDGSSGFVDAVSAASSIMTRSP